MTLKDVHLPPLKYRSDIDGLRAIAVIAVVVFHAFPDVLRGGFIGVDIFFVISGYLISTIIFENLESGTFRFSDFYTRRIRRIFPSLLLVLSACFVFGWFALLPDEYKQLGKHMAAGAGFISNIVLLGEAGYFDNAAETKPLLHLWSLGIEEQFYIVWPLLLWFAWRRKFNLLTMTIFFTIISFVLNFKGVRQDAIATFYSPQTRFWELLCGSLLAWLMLYQRQKLSHIANKIDDFLVAVLYTEKQKTQGQTLANCSSLLGLLLVTYGLLHINKELRFPGEWALIPVTGAVLLLAAGPDAVVNRKILSARLLVWFGLISFPLYLWHWPLLSFARIVESEVPSIEIRLQAAVLSIVLAWLTYLLIERPMRFGKYGRAKIITLVFLMIVIGYVGFNTYQRDGLKFRLLSSKAQIGNINSADLLNESINNCLAYFPDWDKVTDNPCRFQRKTKNTIAIIGDSHAGHLYAGLSESVDSGDGVIAFAASCAAPYIDIASATSDINARKVREGAYKLINAAYDFVIRDPDIKIVILAHNPLCSSGDVKDMANPGNKDENRVLKDGMIRTFQALTQANKKVVVLFDNPFLPFEPNLCVNRPFRLTNNRNKCLFPREEFDSLTPFSNYKSVVNSVLKEFPQIRTYDLADPFCDAQYCYLAKNNALLYRDRGHLNDSGSRYVAPYIMNMIGSPKK